MSAVRVKYREDRTNHATADQWAALEALGVQRRPDRHVPSVRGQAHGNAKLNDADVREISVRHAAGDPVQLLAEQFGVSPASISNVATRRTWSHVQ